jgi:hypothetical protein
VGVATSVSVTALELLIALIPAVEEELQGLVVHVRTLPAVEVKEISMVVAPVPVPVTTNAV